MPAAAYDQTRRNRETDRFYHSAAWKRCRAAQLAAVPWCQYVRAGETEPCGRPATHVHHLDPIATPAGWAKRLDRGGMMCVCVPCHNRAEADAARPVLPDVYGCPEYAATDDYYYDPAAAERPLKFVARYCRFPDGPLVGQLYDPLPWQAGIVRTLYGWKRRDTGLRRFRELYLLTAKGSGKTPLLAAIGLYELLAGGEPAPWVISMASTFEQAAYTFGERGAKGYLMQSPALDRFVKRLQFVIRTADGFGKWTTVSGKNNGRSGSRPSCIIADELHEWTPGTGEAFEMLTANAFKRSQPLILMATNAGDSRQSYAWRVHERAVGVATGKLDDPTLLPVVYETPKGLPWDSEAAATAANPSLGTFIGWERYAPLLAKARSSPGEQAKYERLQLSRWIGGGANKWLDVPARWDPCVTAAFQPPAEAALYVGLDLSDGDDLCAAAFVWVLPGRAWVDAEFWLPRETADHYRRKNEVPFDQWAAAGAVELLDARTIGPDVHKHIAARVQARGKVVACCYDRAKAVETVAELTAAGVECRPVGQGWGVSAGVAELDRGMTERTVTFSNNAVLRWCAENVDLKTDDRGNRWPVKPRAKGTYAGTRSAKIDGITAVVTALTEARKHNFPKRAVNVNAWSI